MTTGRPFGGLEGYASAGSYPSTEWRITPEPISPRSRKQYSTGMR